MSQYIAVPYMKTEAGEWNLPDSVLQVIWGQLVLEDRAQETFWDGSVQTEADFIRFYKGESHGPVQLLIIVDLKAIPRGLGWITYWDRQGVAEAHFAALGTPRMGVALAAMQFWSKVGVVKTLLAFQPVTLVKARRVAELVGFTFLSPAIPGLCRMAATGETVPGIVGYYSFEGGEA